jgi:hypothetical protein
LGKSDHPIPLTERQRTRRPDWSYLFPKEESKRRAARAMLKKTSMEPYTW